ncbi:DUF3347 domain-containing protein [Chitinophaga nivalis]|uniref:DUF3347 domain-containing protein n=1 Tax=Chitinophaga nivalis TaxID=2991709 RepID=A0ABT3IQ71_9BACT|nr:DUF3347 domain-containing protein [Chitinophaga nivalis]MCW3464201.1 DUF3347 domain-containing protein [Chitinophaga nivalis]MCW3486109.1 DUF3347 domain-containing protein [Chitinophaga nivalis]
MRTIITGVITLATFTFVACNSNNNATSHAGHGHDSTAAAAPAETPAETVNTVAPQFTNLDAKVAASWKTVVDSYLQLKNGLAADDDAAAAKAGKEMAAALAKLDKQLLTPEQAKVYQENEEDLLEHASHIGQNAGNIAHQREHFETMSEEVYVLVKAFGGGQPLYQDFCPMYNDNKGAYWLSEAKDVKNPYQGSKMSGCGIVKEMIR